MNHRQRIENRVKFPNGTATVNEEAAHIDENRSLKKLFFEKAVQS